MKNGTQLRLRLVSLLVLVIGIMFAMVLAYLVLGLVQLTMFTVEVISRGGYG